MSQPLKSYLPCPCCHDIGGRGYLEQWTLPDLPPFFVCEECNASWRDLDDIRWNTGESFHMSAERLGWDCNVADRAAVRSKLNLFCIGDEELQQHVLHVLEHGHLVRPAEGPVHYRQLRLDEVIGCRGEQVLVVMTASNLPVPVAFPSRTEVAADFHFW